MTDKKNEIQIKISDDVLKGVYANNVLITHTRGEFLMDFMTIFHPQGILGARVIVSPSHAKRIVNALNDNIIKYEKKFGVIEEAEAPPMPEGGVAH